MQIECPVGPAAAARLPISAGELPEVLMLVRASTLKMIRLQLAMERHDRRVALEAVDDLVALDRRLQDYIACTGGDEQLLFRQGLDHERAMLNREKLTLAAGISLRPQQETSAPQSSAADEPWAGTNAWMIADEQMRRSRRWLFAIPVAASLIAACAYFADMPAAQAWLAATGLG